MRSRISPRQGTLIAKHLQMVDTNWDLYERMVAENPRLLTKLSAWLVHVGQETVGKCEDAIPLMRKTLLDLGLPPQAWRCLARHGMRPFVYEARDTLRWSVLQKLLQTLHVARWPALPPRGFFALLHDTTRMPQSYFGDKDSEIIPGWFWNWACNAAAQCAGDTQAYTQLKDDVVR